MNSDAWNWREWFSDEEYAALYARIVFFGAWA